MALQLSVAARDGQNNAIETELGASPILKIRTGAQPANCAAADSGTALATLNLPADPFSNSAGGVKEKSGTWTDATADASGTAGHWRLYKNDGTTCVAQGAAGTAGTEMILDSVSFTAGQPFTVNSFAFTAGNA